MREALFRVRTLARHRVALALFGVLAVAACALVGLPLMGMPGYELAAALSLAIGLGGAVVGVLFGRQERAGPATLRGTGHAIAAAFVTLALLLVPPFVASTLYALLATPCDPFATLAFFPVLTLPTCLVVAAAGVFIGVATRRWWTALLAWLGVVLASAAHTAWPIVFGPQLFAYNHLAGYLPGPLYDEELRLPASLVWFRLGSVCLAGVFWALAAWRRRIPRAGLLLLPCALAFVAVESLGVWLGFRMSDEALARALGGVFESTHVVLRYPAGKRARDVERIVRDLEFRHAQISTFLGGPPPGKVTVWWYRSAAEKLRLVGASHTQFAKPWRREVHVNDAAWPHAAIKHELVHAMAGPLGAPPFGATATWLGLYPHIGIVEGLAVAGDNPVDDLTLHAWTAAMKKQALLPDVRVLLSPAGFYAVPASRAYTTAGSFMRWLGDTRGGEKLRRLYRSGDFTSVYGEGLPELASAFEDFLDTVELEPEAVNQAFGRFKRGSLFERPCAREVARIAAEAQELVAERPLEALGKLSRCRSLQPEEPSHVLAEVAALRRLGRDADARAALERLEATTRASHGPRAEAAMALADLDVAAGDEVHAQALLEQVLELRASPAMDRTARVKLAALAMPPKAKAAVQRYFGAEPEEVKLFALRDALVLVPGDPFLSYLVGRRLQQAGASAEALPYLEVGSLPPSLHREATRLAIEAAFQAGRCDRVRTLVDSAGLGQTFAARAADWAQRCDFERP